MKRTQFHSISLDGTWVAIPEHPSLVFFRDKNIPLYARIYHLALTYLNLNKHAEFGRGEMADLLAVDKLDKATGEVKLTPPTIQGINKAIKYLKELGIVEDDSCSRCIHFSNKGADKGSKSGIDCNYHKERPFRK